MLDLILSLIHGGGLTAAISGILAFIAGALAIYLKGHELPLDVWTVEDWSQAASLTLTLLGIIWLLMQMIAWVRKQRT